MEATDQWGEEEVEEDRFEHGDDARHDIIASLPSCSDHVSSALGSTYTTAGLQHDTLSTVCGMISNMDITTVECKEVAATASILSAAWEMIEGSSSKSEVATNNACIVSPSTAPVIPRPLYSSCVLAASVINEGTVLMDGYDKYPCGEISSHNDGDVNTLRSVMLSSTIHPARFHFLPYYLSMNNVSKI